MTNNDANYPPRTLLDSPLNSYSSKNSNTLSYRSHTHGTVIYLPKKSLHNTLSHHKMLTEIHKEVIHHEVMPYASDNSYLSSFISGLLLLPLLPLAPSHQRRTPTSVPPSSLEAAATLSVLRPSTHFLTILLSAADAGRYTDDKVAL